MLADKDVYAIVAVNDIEAAKKFYEGILGLIPASEDPGGIFYKCGNSKILVYKSQYAGSNGATSATWRVGDVPATVAALKAKGVVFEQYDIPNVTYDSYDGDIHVLGNNQKAAWFKDPDGNVLCVSNDV